MANYSIKELELITGIKAHTIRIWEQRYNILAPNRTDTNIRYYTEEDLKRLLNISLLNKNGFKISRIAQMTDDYVKEKVLALCNNNFEYNTQVDALTVSMIELNEHAFEKTIATNIAHAGFENAFLHVVFPFLHKIGILWQTAAIRPAQEHFMSNLIRQKIIAATDRLEPADFKGRRYTLFLPAFELHELSLLFMNYIIRSRGGHTLYLGASVPFEDVIATYIDYNADILVTTCISYPAENAVQDYIDKLSANFSDSQILISGRQVLSMQVKTPSNVLVLRNLYECVQFVNRDLNYDETAAGNNGVHAAFN